MIAQVIVDIAHRDVDQVFDYRNDLELPVGSRVSVPFGRQKKEGIIVGNTDHSDVPAEKLKAIEKPLDEEPVLNEEGIELGIYIAATYHTTMTQALKLLLPSKLRGGQSSIQTQNFIELMVEGEAYERALASLMKKDGTPRSPRQVEVMEQLRMAPQGIRMSQLPYAAVKALLKKEFVRLRMESIGFFFEEEERQARDIPATQLSGDQKAALYTVLHSGKSRFLLFGVTGSGKTEVYIQVIRNLLAQGKTAILLVPEISLTPQTHDYMCQRLDAEIALFHSRLSDAERYEQWMKVKSGRAPVVIGPRSAVFAPLNNLGAIIIDEEQEQSYKSDRFPCYTAKEIAEFRCARNDALLILGSATPSLDSYKDTLEGKYTLIEMPQRLFGLGLPPVEIVDMRKEMQSGNSSIISTAVADAVGQALGRGEQSMILLNRRGYSSFLMCRSCGHVIECDNCDVSMTYHKSEGMLKCHYCGERKSIPAACPACGNGRMQQIGIGTQKLEEELAALFPKARILRMDTDSMSGRDAYLRAYEKFRDGGADILIGTQMIAKGFDFDRVTVAAVVSTDTMLHYPDYRSAEHTFDQIMQLAGRAGRKCPGRVFIQTYSPDHYAITDAAAHDYRSFFEEESAFRRATFLPPYGMYVMVRFTSEKEDDAKVAVKDFMQRVKLACGAHVNDIIKARASESPIKRIKEQYRYQILVHLRHRKSPVTGVLLDLVGQARYRNVLVGVDIDPANLS